MQVSGGSVASSTLKVTGGILGLVLIRANTNTTLFRASVSNKNSVVIRNYAFHTGEIVDHDTKTPVQGQYTINITNASVADETFRILFAVAEG